MPPFTEHPGGIFSCSWHTRSWIFLFLCKFYSKTGVLGWICRSMSELKPSGNELSIFIFSLLILKMFQQIFNNILQICLTLKIGLLLPSQSYLSRFYDLVYDLAWSGSYLSISTFFQNEFFIWTKNKKWFLRLFQTWSNYMTTESQLRFYSHICDFTALKRCNRW